MPFTVMHSLCVRSKSCWRCEKTGHWSQATMRRWPWGNWRQAARPRQHCRRCRRRGSYYASQSALPACRYPHCSSACVVPSTQACRY